MTLDIDYFKAIQNATGLTSSQGLVVQNNKTRLLTDLKSSINYKPSAKVNGITQPVVITTGKEPFKSTIIALPNNSLCVGDLIESDGNRWLVVSVNTTNPIQVVGAAWLCNQLLRFQNGTTTILESYGVLDNGSYSVSGDNKIQIISDKYKIYLPHTANTKKIYIDKRLATNKAYDKDGKEILVTYKVTGFDSVSESYGTGGHLLILNVIASSYDASTDSLTEMICDYVASSSSGGTSSPTLLPCSITTARPSILTGTSFKFAVTFYKADGTVNSSAVAVWTVTPTVSGITSTPNGNSIVISVANNDSLAGQTILISVTDTGGLYNTATYTTEVV